MPSGVSTPTNWLPSLTPTTAGRRGAGRRGPARASSPGRWRRRGRRWRRRPAARGGCGRAWSRSAVAARAWSPRSRRRSRRPDGRAARPACRTARAGRPSAKTATLSPSFDGLVDVVGDQDDGLAELALEPQELVLQARPYDRVDGRRTARPSAAPAGRPPAPGRRRRAAAGRRRAGGDSGRRTRPGRGRPGPAARGPAREPAPWASPMSERHRGDVGGDLLVGEQPDLLDHVADPAPQLDGVLVGDVASPSRKIRPLVGSISRLIIFRVVDLPQPEGPTRHDELAGGAPRGRARGPPPCRRGTACRLPRAGSSVVPPPPRAR